MSFDASRFSFDPWNDFSGVVMQQGRVQLDSDWNEWLAIQRRRIQAGTLDIVGRAVVPATTPNGFLINASQSGGSNVLTIGAGRMYVDGLLVENHGTLSSAQFDPALAELSCAPQLTPPAAEFDLNFIDQPYLPGAALPTGNGPFIVYLDVWQRAVTYLEDPDLIERAVGIDTTGRLQTVWQVKLLDVSSVKGGVTCTTAEPWTTATEPSASRLTTDVAQSGTPGPCCLTPNTGYTGRENQLYRVEIHQGKSPNPSDTSAAAAATFKWSRDNASVATAVTAINSATSGGQSTSALSVASTGKDNVLCFKPGDWIEITDDVRELNGKAGDLRQIAVGGVDATNKTITLTAPVSADIVANLTTPPGNITASHTRICRWDQGGIVYKSDGTVWTDLTASTSTGDIPVPPSGTILILEDGITVAFDLAPTSGAFTVGDFWTFAARASDGWVQPLKAAPPMGVHHHFARLAVLTFPGPPTDCRAPWPPPATGTGPDCGCVVCIETDTFKNAADIVNAVVKASTSGGGRVCFGPGVFDIGSSPVVLSKVSNVTLCGQGPATRITFEGSGPAFTLDQGLLMRFEDLTIEASVAAGEKPAQTGLIGLLLQNSAGVAVERCAISAVQTTVGVVVEAESQTNPQPAQQQSQQPPQQQQQSQQTQQSYQPQQQIQHQQSPEKPPPAPKPSGVKISVDKVKEFMAGNAQTTTPPDSESPYTESASATFGTLGTMAIAVNGLIAELEVRDSALSADVGIGKAGLFASGKEIENRPWLVLAGCLIQNNVMVTVIAGVALGDAGVRPGFCFHLIETAIDSNTVFSGFLGLYVEGLTYPGATVRIERNQVETDGFGIVTNLDAALVADNVITQADVVSLLRGEVIPKVGAGILVFDVTGVASPLLDVRVLRNRVCGVAGPGIVIDAPAVTVAVVDNTIQGVVGAGITVGGQALVADLLMRGNDIFGVVGPVLPGAGAIIGIGAGLALDAHVTGNTIVAVGNATGETEVAVGLLLLAAASGTAQANKISDIGAGGAQIALGIWALSAAYDFNISTNVVRQATLPGQQVGLFVGLAVSTDASVANIAVSAQDNVITGTTLLPLVVIGGAADCVFLGNRCERNAAPSGVNFNFPADALDQSAIVVIYGATAVASNNRIQGPEGIVGLLVNVTGTQGSGSSAVPAATILGNIVSREITLMSSNLAAPWRPLNIITPGN